MNQCVTTGRRGGWTLVELLCVISVLASMMGVVAMFLGSTYKFNRDTQIQLQLHATVNRLARQFRDDARKSISMAAEGHRVMLTLPHDRLVSYHAEDGNVVRTELELGRQLTRDGHWLPRPWQSSWSRDDQVATMTLTRGLATALPSIRPGRSIVIQARLGGDLRTRERP